jgi:hypothetical protein
MHIIIFDSIGSFSGECYLWVVSQRLPVRTWLSLPQAHMFPLDSALWAFVWTTFT